MVETPNFPERMTKTTQVLSSDSDFGKILNLT
jgi:hypothetical protein